MKMVPMARTADDKKADSGMSGMSADAMPDHPHGMRVRLESPELDKLGLDKLPAAGKTFALRATGKVSRVSASDSSGHGEAVELVITHLAMAPDGAAPDRGAKMYDKAKPAAEPAAPAAPPAAPMMPPV